jgi:ubiquinone/menaquinone biosynthesis C-methylase UbiE
LPGRPSDEALKNRAFWDRQSDDYQQRHREFINRPDPRWGVWQLPESELAVLGDVAGKDVLELGCGAAQWSILLAQRGARPVGLDNSERQLEHARRRMADVDVDFPLVHSSAEDVPLPDESFDIVFCDHGAMSWADPYRTVPETARLLRAGGLLAFSQTSAIATLCWDRATDLVGPELRHDYFGLHRSTRRITSSTSSRTASGSGCSERTGSSSRT